MKSKILNLLLIITSLFGYLEWGGGNHSFLYEAEAEFLSKLFASPGSVFHPLTILPFVGQLLLLVSLFQKEPCKVLSYIGMAGTGILLVFMFVVGLLSLNFKIVLSTLPFLIVLILAWRHHRTRA